MTGVGAGLVFAPPRAPSAERDQTVADVNPESSPEFSRLIRADRLADRDTEFSFLCEPVERRRLADRFSLLDIERLEARVWARRVAGAPVVRVRVNVVADVLQSCVVTLDPVETRVDEWFEIDCVPESDVEGGREVVFDPEEDDPPETMRDGSFDVGEAIAERLALSLDGYPRKPGAEFAAHAAPADEGRPADGPFAVLGDGSGKSRARGGRRGAGGRPTSR